MAHYLHLINYHSKSLLHEVLQKVSGISCFSMFTYAQPDDWGPAISQNSLIDYIIKESISLVDYKNQSIFPPL